MIFMHTIIRRYVTVIIICSFSVYHLKYGRLALYSLYINVVLGFIKSIYPLSSIMIRLELQNWLRKMLIRITFKLY